jgi:galactonate dehydratase
VRAYANGWYRTERTPEAFAAAAKDVAERGYGAMKFDPFGSGMGVLTPREEALSVEIVAAVREAVGPDVDLAIECHSRFSLATAVRIGRKIEPYQPAWFEEPVPHGNIPAIIEVARHLDIPVAAGENLSSKHQLAELLSFNEISIINIEPLHMGGILGSRKAADMIDAHYGHLIPHAAQGPICTVACLHIDAASPNAWLQETFEEFNAPWELSLITGFPAIKDGYFELPAGPGLGIDINLDEVARHPYNVNCEINLFDEGWHLRKPTEPGN